MLCLLLAGIRGVSYNCANIPIYDVGHAYSDTAANSEIVLNDVLVLDFLNDFSI